jgi:hypothetical protein
MFSNFYANPIPGKTGLPLELKEVVMYDQEATRGSPPDHCWVCREE